MIDWLRDDDWHDIFRKTPFLRKQVMAVYDLDDTSEGPYRLLVACLTDGQWLRLERTHNGEVRYKTFKAYSDILPTDIKELL